MAEIREDVVVIDDDASNDSLFADGSVVVGIVPEKPGTKLAEQAHGVWDRAKAGFEKGKSEKLQREQPSAWERLSTVPETVKGVVGYRTTGTAKSSAAVLVKEELVAVPVAKPRPIPDLIHDATDEVSGLVKAEIALVKTEVKQKVKILGPALGLLIAAVTLLIFALPFLLWAAVFALGLLLPLWAAALIVFVVMLLVAAGLAFAGLKHLKRLGRLQALAGGSIKESIHAIIEAFKGHKWADAQQALKEVRL